MSVLGFKRMTSEDTLEAAMVLPFDAGEEDAAKFAVGAVDIALARDPDAAAAGAAASSSSAAALAEAWAWLAQQLDACLAMRGAAKPQATCCAECALQVYTRRC
jgi:hypothetical protein